MKMRVRSSEERAGRRGSALVFSLVAVSTVVVLAASFTQYASIVSSRQAQAVDRKRAFYVAEAGLAEAYVGLTCGKSGEVGSQEAPALLGEGVFWTHATELSEGVIQLECTGMVGSGRAKLSVVARRGLESVFTLGVFGNKAVTVPAGSRVDAYDSSQGSYASQSDKTGAALGSNAGVVITGTAALPTVISGDVTPGPGKTVTVMGNVQISGSTQPAHAPTVLPGVDVPAVVLGPATVHNSAYPLVIPAGQCGYQSLTIKSGSQLLIQGPSTVVLGALSVESSADVTFDTTNGPIELFVSGNCNLATGSLVSTSGTEPADVLVQVSGTPTSPVTLRASGNLYGLVFVPQAQVILGSPLKVFGALVADKVTLEGAAQLHFDKNLAAVAAEERMPRQLAWRIVDMGSIGEASSDPFDVLGLDKTALLPPAESHKDQVLVIDYYDYSNVYHTYDGLESQFDWTVVKDVIEATRDAEDVFFPRSPLKTGLKKSPGVLPVVDGPMV